MAHGGRGALADAVDAVAPLENPAAQTGGAGAPMISGIGPGSASGVHAACDLHDQLESMLRAVSRRHVRGDARVRHGLTGGAPADDLPVVVGAVGVSGCQNVQGLQQVRLALSVAAGQQRDALARLENLRGVVPEVGQ